MKLIPAYIALIDLILIIAFFIFFMLMIQKEIKKQKGPQDELHSMGNHGARSTDHEHHRNPYES